MIGTSTIDYILIRTCILGLRAIAPLSILYTAYSVFRPPHVPVLRALLVWTCLETAFYFLVYLPRKWYLQRPAQHPVLASREDRLDLFRKCVVNIPDPDRYLGKWFLGSPLEDIKRENVKDFFRWAFLSTKDWDEAHEDELEEYVNATEQSMGRKIEPGWGKAKCLKLTLDAVDMQHRSLLWYMIVSFVDNVTSGYMWYNGFTLHRTSLRQYPTMLPSRPQTIFCQNVSPSKHLSYWYRPHTSKTRLPILFIHGIGIGLWPYCHFLGAINHTNNKSAAGSEEDGQIGIIALEIMPISFRITHAIPDKDTICSEIDSILKTHGWDKFVLMSHSYGSVIATHLLQIPTFTPKIGPMIFVDPVCFLLHLPDVAYNFTARKPVRPNERQLYYFASMDMGVSHTLSRHFFWGDNILWKEDLQSGVEGSGRPVTAVLGGRDLIVDTQVVGKYLSDTRSSSEDPAARDWHDETWKDVCWRGNAWEGKGLEVVWFETLDHARVFETKNDYDVLVRLARKYTEQGGKAGANGHSNGKLVDVE